MSIADIDLRALQTSGYCHLKKVLSAEESVFLSSLFDQDALFRSRVVMEKHGFGAGEYAYFKDPLPPLVADIRRQFYDRLAPLANETTGRLKQDITYPGSLEAFHAYCQSQGQSKPTPLLLKYEADGYNRLHRDLYGDVLFPYQMMIMLSRPGIDFGGGEFVLVENCPRQQSIAHVLTPEQGDVIVFPTSMRAAKGAKGDRKIAVRHGVSVVRKGTRMTAGIIFHQAS